MREIKFRGKRKDNNEWVYGGIYIDCKKVVILTTEKIGGSAIIDEVHPKTVGQFTGQMDKFNGEEIYEGQKVRAFYDQTLIGKEIDSEEGIVIWNNDLSCFSVDTGTIRPAFSCFDLFKILEN